MRNHYHDTLHVSPQLRIQYEATAANQDGRILNFLREHSYRDFSANEIRDRIGEPMLLTSIRRALTRTDPAGRGAQGRVRQEGRGLHHKVKGIFYRKAL
jgi:hypothetical protein